MGPELLAEHPWMAQILEDKAFKSLPAARGEGAVADDGEGHGNAGGDEGRELDANEVDDVCLALAAKRSEWDAEIGDVVEPDTPFSYRVLGGAGTARRSSAGFKIKKF